MGLRTTSGQIVRHQMVPLIKAPFPCALQGPRVADAGPRGNAWRGPWCVPEQALVHRAAWHPAERVGR